MTLTGTETLETLLRERLAPLAPSEIELIDDSARHAGHAGARNGGGHYRLRIVSAAFSGRNALVRHRQVLDALGDLMQGRIHALSIKPIAPEEV